MNTTSISLLRRLREPGQKVAWQRFVELYTPLVFHWAREQGLNPPDAADTVQEVMAAMVVQLPGFRYDSGRRFRGWLRTIVVNKARDFHRRNGKRPVVGIPPSVARNQTGGDIVEPLEDVEYRGVLIRRALEIMRSEFREKTWKACWMHVAEGRKAKDVAQELGMTANAVHVAKCRVIRRLRQELQGLID